MAGRSRGIWYVVSYCWVLCSSNPSQREQREELAALIKKYGDAWEPWRNDLKLFRDGGKKLVD